MKLLENFNFFIIFMLGHIQVETFNLEDLTKTELLSMKTHRCGFTPICVGKYIYALGGRYSNGTCER